MSDHLTQNLETYISQHLDTIIVQLCELIKIPSISSMTEHAPDTRRILEAMSALVAPYGFSSRIHETAGHPAMIATLEVAPERPWVLIYNHMDVQPAKEPQWETEPFTPVIQAGKIYGRGSTDDKGPALTTLHAIHFLNSHGFELPNIQLLYETEEEIGSRHFGAFLDQNRSQFKEHKSILVSDTIFEGTHPTLTYQLRGLQMVEIELNCGSKDLHSGIFGGVVRNPLNILIHALAQCVDSQGKVLIPGFYEHVRQPDEQELNALKAVAEKFDLQKIKCDSGEASFYTEDSLELLQRLWLRPTFEVHGFEGVQFTPGVIKSALPYHVKAKVTMRLVPGQESADILHKLTTYLQGFDPAIQVISKGGAKPCMTDQHNPFMDCAYAACDYGFGLPPLYVGGGGTIGAIPELQRVFPGKPVVLLAQSLMSDGYHAPNEHFRISQIQDGIKTMASYLNRIAELR